ncbi:ribonuclease [Bacillus sp. FJAT-42376]|uniref:ribonuclease domain-containing protein n=1 Tax=Bacillus sp. FJAT-42376 TaxID=2014076 RepID=UPI000F4F6BEA|nr:ribonuclease domain-containing protein [Bacillus sp. FJAT-42376]AZB41421.1 ribonuclease [Bacillus sp. FJAT-42376]
MNKLLKFGAMIALVFALTFGGVSAGSLKEAPEAKAAALEMYPTSFTGIIDYLKAYGELPANFVTKSVASQYGWVSSQCNLADVLPGYSIGGDVFSNREGKLPSKSGRVYYEADAYYTSGCRNASRVVYSNDGLYYTTSDHYATFKRVY